MSYTNNKFFDESLDKKYDSFGKDVVSDLFYQLKQYNVMIHTDEYDKAKCGDLFVIKPCGNGFVVEVEVKNHWAKGREPFSYKTIRFPQRKQKKHFESVKYFCMVSSDGLGVLIVTKKSIQEALPYWMKVSNYKHKEQWVDVPVKNARFYFKDENMLWKKFNHE